MHYKLFWAIFFASYSFAISQDQIILRNNDTIHCKLTNIDKYYTYFKSPLNTKYILYVRNLHIKKIKNTSLKDQNEWLSPSVDTSNYKANRRIQIARFKKIPKAERVLQSDGTYIAPKKSLPKTIAKTDPNLIPTKTLTSISFGVAPVSIGLGVKNASKFKYNNIGHSSLTLNVEILNLNAIGFSTYFGYNSFLYHASYLSPDENTEASFTKKESGFSFGFGPNFSVKTSASSFVKFNTLLALQLDPVGNFSDIKIRNKTLISEDNTHSKENKYFTNKIGLDFTVSFNKQLTRGMVFSFGIGYKGRKQDFLDSDYGQISNNVSINNNKIIIDDRLGFQTEHYLTTFVNIGGLF